MRYVLGVLGFISVAIMAIVGFVIIAIPIVFLLAVLFACLTA